MNSLPFLARVRWQGIALGLMGAVLLAGCGGENLAPVSGKITYNGAPVKGGTIVFSPIGEKMPGKAASAEVKSDGSFSVSTNRANDGALVGKHRITYSPPEPELTEAQRTDPKYTAPPSPYARLTPRQTEIEVKPGPNAVEIELIPRQR